MSSIITQNTAFLVIVGKPTPENQALSESVEHSLGLSGSDDSNAYLASHYPDQVIWRAYFQGRDRYNRHGVWENDGEDAQDVLAKNPIILDLRLNPNVVKLNEKHNALVNHKTKIVTVGCQDFEFDRVLALADAVKAG